MIAPMLGDPLEGSCCVVLGTSVDTIVVNTAPLEVTVALLCTTWPFAKVVGVDVTKVDGGLVEVTKTLLVVRLEGKEEDELWEAPTVGGVGVGGGFEGGGFDGHGANRVAVGTTFVEVNVIVNGT
jgi:hypothetical protein